jgi:hypothetical protein
LLIRLGISDSATARAVIFFVFLIWDKRHRTLFGIKINDSVKFFSKDKKILITAAFELLIIDTGIHCGGNKTYF